MKPWPLNSLLAYVTSASRIFPLNRKNAAFTSNPERAANLQYSFRDSFQPIDCELSESVEFVFGDGVFYGDYFGTQRRKHRNEQEEARGGVVRVFLLGVESVRRIQVCTRRFGVLALPHDVVVPRQSDVRG